MAATIKSLLILSAGLACGQNGTIRLDHPAIEYVTRPLKDPVAELSRKVQAGQVQLRFEGEQGYLRSVLEALDVPVESQMAVFSKTSVQQMRIDPQHPRVLYFNDSVVVGWVPRGTLELAALDPRQGIIFYTVDQRPWVSARVESPFQRRTDCLTCHVSKVTGGIPGMLLRSVVPAADGTPLRRFGVTDTDQRTPFEKLWGGWYVTGESGSARHMGNTLVSGPVRPNIDTRTYLSPHSDIVALMVFAHQTHMTNLLIDIGWKTRIGMYRDEALREAARDLVDYLLFVDQPPLSARIEGTSGFDAWFAARGQHDSQGRSLRQFDLEHGLMRYPCSYMIYSDAFEGLPAEAKEAIYQRMWQILSGEEKGVRYGRLSLADRKAIVEILRDTMPRLTGLPDYFRDPLR